MSKHCIECNQKKGFLAANYAGVNLRTSVDHVFPDRIEAIVLPGERSTDFLCVTCANQHKATCSAHGLVHAQMTGGVASQCKSCQKLKGVVKILNSPWCTLSSFEDDLNNLIGSWDQQHAGAIDSDFISVNAIVSLLYLLHAEEKIAVNYPFGYMDRGIGPNKKVREPSGPTWPGLAAESHKFSRLALDLAGDHLPDLATLIAHVVERSLSLQSEQSSQEAPSRSVSPEEGLNYCHERWGTAGQMLAFHKSDLRVKDFYSFIKTLPGSIPLVDEVGLS
jgi:hypothetical protein